MSDSEPRQPFRELRSFGRKRGRKISARQQALLRDVLPRVAVDLSAPAPSSLAQLFAVSVADTVRQMPLATASPKDVWLEIGFGGSEHMIAQARANPDVGLIGCEPFEDGIVKALTAIDELGLTNVRIHGDDVRPVLRWLPPESLGRVFMLYPDPWPKKRHEKRRLFSAELLGLLARVTRAGAELRLATDSGDYARTALLSVVQHGAFQWHADSPADWRARGPDWPQTRYEAKAVRDGRVSYYLRFSRRP
jgi:tRNA (guanine-N7-)-methyltransferase